jgi:hypothetical protein
MPSGDSSVATCRAAAAASAQRAATCRIVACGSHAPRLARAFTPAQFDQRMVARFAGRPVAAEWATCRSVGHRRAARDGRRRSARRTSRREPLLQVRSRAAPTAAPVRVSAAMQKRLWRRLSTLAPRRGQRMREAPAGSVGMLQARARGCDGATARDWRRTASKRLLAQVRRSTVHNARRTHAPAPAPAPKEGGKPLPVHAQRSTHRREFRRLIRRRFHGMACAHRNAARGQQAAHSGSDLCLAGRPGGCGWLGRVRASYAR